MDLMNLVNQISSAKRVYGCLSQENKNRLAESGITSEMDIKSTEDIERVFQMYRNQENFGEYHQNQEG